MAFHPDTAHRELLGMLAYLAGVGIVLAALFLAYRAAIAPPPAAASTDGSGASAPVHAKVKRWSVEPQAMDAFAMQPPAAANPETQAAPVHDTDGIAARAKAKAQAEIAAMKRGSSRPRDVPAENNAGFGGGAPARFDRHRAVGF